MHNIPAAPTIEGATHLHSGKVRDLYRLEDGALLMVASDRISAYDFVLESTIPDKGEILTRMSLWWFAQLADLVPNHVRSTDVPEAVKGRAIVCEELAMYPVECVVRGYLSGSGLIDYRSTGEVCGIALPTGLVEASRLPAPIFTPATKAALGDHDENVSFERVVADIGPEAASELRELSLAVYTRADELARERGIILADTKLEFGSRRDAPSATGTGGVGDTVLGDEVLTPDSSRYWPAADWHPGRAQDSYDKQIVRDWLTSPASGWDRSASAPPPPLPDEVVDRTRARYVEAFELLTGGTVLMSLTTSVEYAVPVDVVFGYLADPRNRPEWQSSLRRVEMLDEGAPRVGMRWRDVTAARIEPEMVITEMEADLLWAETGRWRAIEADLTLGFAPSDGGCTVTVEFGVRGTGLLRPVGWVATRAGLFAVRSDLRQSARILAGRTR